MIRKAEYKDINAVSAIYDHIHESENCTGWIQGIYPVKKTAEAALQRQDLFVYEEDGVIAAAAIINQQQVDVYEKCFWKYQAEDSQVMVLHTLVVDPGASRKGIGKKMVSFYEGYAKMNGCTVLRMDTNEKNIIARKLYASLGYREAGIEECVFNGIEGCGLVLLEKTAE